MMVENRCTRTTATSQEKRRRAYQAAVAASRSSDRCTAVSAGVGSMSSAKGGIFARARTRSNQRQHPVGLSLGGGRILVLPVVEGDKKIKERPALGIERRGGGGGGWHPPLQQQ